MQIVGSTLLNRLRNIYDPLDPAPVRKPCDLIEFYPSSYTPPAGKTFDPAGAVQRFAAINITVGGLVYMRKSLERGAVQKVRGQQANTITLRFSNVDTDRYLALWAQTTQIEGMWLVIRYIERDIAGQWAMLFIGRAGKPSTINNGEFTISGTTEIGNLNQTLPPRKFTSFDPKGRDPSDPQYEGFRFVNLPNAVFTDAQVVPSTSFFGRLFGRHKTVYTTYQYSSTDATPYGHVVPEVLGRCQMELIPFLWLDRGLYIIYNMAAANGPIAGISTIKSRTQGISDPLNSFSSPPAPPEIHLGDKGGTGTNAAGWIQFPQAGVFSHTAGISAGSTGERPDSAAVVPTISAIVQGRKMPLPSGGIYAPMNDETTWGWTDNPIHQTRFIFTNFMGIREALMADAANLKRARFCDWPVLDRTNGEQIIVTSEASRLARFRSSGILSAAFMRRYMLGDTGVNDPVITPSNPDGTWSPGDPSGIPTSFTVQNFLRKRYTFNAPITDEIKAYDYLFKTLYPAFRGYHLMNAMGRIEIRLECAGDNGLLRAASAIGDTRLKVDDITPWADDLSQRVLVGYPASLQSEVRLPTGFEWTAEANAITLTASASGIGAIVSGATLSGGDATHQSSGTVTLTGTAGAGASVNITIQGIQVGYTLTADDTLSSAALMLVQAILSETRLARFIDASASGAVITIKAKWGVLILDSALAFAHVTWTTAPTSAPTVSAVTGTMKAGTYYVAISYNTAVGETTISPLASVVLTDGQAVYVGALGTLPTGVQSASVYLSESPGSPVLLYATDTDGTTSFTMNGLPAKSNAPVPAYNTTAEEVLRIAMAFSDNTQGASRLQQAGLGKANIVKDSYNFPLGDEQSSVNQVKGEFRDSKNDFALTPFQVDDPVHQSLVGKANSSDLDLTGVDNWNQASRLSNLMLNKLRDCDWFNGLKTGSGEALLLDEDDIIASSSDSGGHVNITTRIEAITISPEWQVSIDRARRYTTASHESAARQHIIPMPTTLRYSTAAPPAASNLTLTATGYHSGDGSWHAEINGIFNFGGFIGQQRARLFIKLHSDPPSAYTEALHRSVFPDGNNQGSFKLTDLAPGSYDIQVRTESFYGYSDVAGALTQTFNLEDNPPQPMLTLQRISNDLVSTWTPGASTTFSADAEEMYVWRVYRVDTGALIRTHTIRRNEAIPGYWTYFAGTGTQTFVNRDPNGSISCATGKGGFLSYRSQPFFGNGVVSWDVDNRRMGQVTIGDATTNTTTGVMVWDRAGVAPSDPDFINAESFDSLKKRLLPLQHIEIVLQNHAAEYRLDGKFWARTAQAPLPDSFRIFAGFLADSVLPEDQAMLRLQFTPEFPRQFVYTKGMQDADFAALGVSTPATVRVEVAQVTTLGTESVAASQIG